MVEKSLDFYRRFPGDRDRMRRALDAAASAREDQQAATTGEN